MAYFPQIPGLDKSNPQGLTGNETVTLSGDVTGSGATSITATIANDAVTLAKMANIDASSGIKLLGRSTASSGDPELLTPAQAGINKLSKTITALTEIARSLQGAVSADNTAGIQIADSASAQFSFALDPTTWAGKTVNMRAVVSTLNTSASDVAYRAWIGYSTTALDGSVVYNATGATKLPDETVRTYPASVGADYLANSVTLPSNVAIPSNATLICAFFEFRRTDALDTCTVRAQLIELRIFEV